ncbi:hypothetical protein PILCRDRAFT_98037 [Piloderma croceum F 1598]|uniref:serine C-palmitoyltransferase n=1 Tax=Piloderma croceum (strain F 1598) TaxID=765440 RepID=A0A0C3F5Q7_PILCF|nr:hypothetical protein PILCRDRAFT_98037 [Piloderma croceum F 1598]
MDANPRPLPKTRDSTPNFSASSSVSVTSEDTIVDKSDDFDSSDGLKYPKESSASDKGFKTAHTKFGHCTNEAYKLTAQHDYDRPFVYNFEDLPYCILVSVYFGYASLNSDFDSFYTRRFKRRADDYLSHPVTCVAGRTVVILDRTTDNYNVTQTLTGRPTWALDVSSYDYLGFVQAQGSCADAIEEVLRRYGVCAGGTRLEGGTSDLHKQGEALTAKYIGTEDALISSTEFATNAMFIPALVGKGCLVISDEFNHASIRLGIRFSGANIRTFKHNNTKLLESGHYHMEGTLVNLPAIVELKKISSLRSGQWDHMDITPRSVNVPMGTFSKSFGAAGGYIAGSKDIINRLCMAMTPPVLAQLMGSLATIMGIAEPCLQSKMLDLSEPPAMLLTPDLSKDQQHPGPAPETSLPIWMDFPTSLWDGSEGRTRLRRLAFNARYLHKGLSKLGFITYGHPSTQIVLLLIFNLTKLAIFHRMMKDRATPIAVVIVAYLATSLETCRARVDLVLKACDEIGDILDLKHGRGDRWTS